MIWFYILAAIVVALDQFTKWLVVEYLQPVGSVPLINGVLEFSYVENTGAAFGMMKDSRWLFMIISAAAIVALTFVIAKYAGQYKFASFAVAMILGGGIGNMIDRVRLGYVVDFIYVKIIDFAVFNVADSFVTVGATLLILYLVRELIIEWKKKPEAAAEGAPVIDDGSNDAGSDSEDSAATDEVEKTDDVPGDGDGDGMSDGER